MNDVVDGILEKARKMLYECSFRGACAKCYVVMSIGFNIMVVYLKECTAS